MFAIFFCSTKCNITSEKRYRKSMKFNLYLYIQISENMARRKINLVGLSSTYSKTKYEIKLSRTIDGFFHTDKFV